MEFGRIVFPVNMLRLTESEFCYKAILSKFQDGGHDVQLVFAAADAALPAGRLLAH